MFDTEEYYGGCYDSPEEFEEEDEEEFDMGDYIDYYYDSFKEEMLMRGVDNNE